MKLFIVSDIHGGLLEAQLAVEKYKKSGADRFVCLGDFYYHGPRNPLPSSYAPKKVAELLNPMAKEIVAIRGNCDAEVDQMISDFRFHAHKTYTDREGRLFYFHHGHHHVPKEILDRKPAVIFSGHTHVAVLERKDGIIYANPGSITLPKAEKSQGYFLVDEKGIKHFDLFTDVLLRSIEF